MIALAVMFSNWVICHNSQPAFKIEPDHDNFRRLIENKVVVYGHHTLDILPNHKPLKNCKNIILTHRRDLDIPDATIVTSINELQFVLRNFEPDDVFLIGGTELFHELIDLCSRAILTIIQEDIETDSTSEFFPRLDQRPNWLPGRSSSTHFRDGHQFRQQRFINTNFRKHTSA